MAPVPLEGLQTPVANLPQDGNRETSISLELFMDYIIQKTYQDLTVLAELLPRKTDMERKIEIYKFSARTRLLFVRLLALVKWASNALNVEKSARITSFLDKHSELFVETADVLARMARETLVHARLPSFHLPSAVEVLTTGNYNRLPACIQDKIVPPDPITISEEKSVLQRLNQVIRHRLVSGNLLPQMKDLEIDAGRVTFRVEQEFSVSLTVMGDQPHLPWRLLDLEILVSDCEISDEKALVHPLQKQYIHQVLQARLSESGDPLSEVYEVLHYFCQSLQLEVLYSQTLRLIRDRLDDLIRVDKYICGECLTIAYWKELTKKDSGSALDYKLSVQVDQCNPAKPLAIVHTPSLTNKECEISDLTIRSSQLSIEYLLVHTIYIRTRNRLTDLKQELQSMFKGVECTLAGSPAILSMPVLQPSLRAESLLIAVDTHTGMLQCHIPQYDSPLVPELTAALNENHSKLLVLISELRFWITQKRCEKTLQHLPITLHERLPLLYEPDHPITLITKRRMFIQFHRYRTVILIVSFKENECEIECSFYLCAVKPSSDNHDANDDDIEAKSYNLYLKLESLIEFDTFVMTHGLFTSIDCESSEHESSSATDSGDNGRKRKITYVSARTDESDLQQSKKTKSPAYIIPELAHVVALCNEQIPFVMLAQELTKREIAHQGLQIEANATASVIKLVQLPAPSANIATSKAWNGLLKRLLGVSIRILDEELEKTWLVEFVFYGSPLISSNPKEQGLRRPIYFQYTMGAIDTISDMVDLLLNDWAKIVNLYSLVLDLADYYKMEKLYLRNIANVKSYNYSKLLMSYGPYGSTMLVQWNVNDNKFKVNFSKSPTSAVENVHSLLKEQLQAKLNEDKNLMQIIHILNETLHPLTSISTLPTTPHLGLYEKQTHQPDWNHPVQTFIIMPQSTTIVRIAYQNMYCLELCFRGEGIVTLRDGAYSHFDNSNVVENFTPIQNLSTFLSQYVDKSTITYRRRLQSEDDNPPSPMTIDNSFLAPRHRAGSQSPATQQRDNTRFHPPMTPPLYSNPNTPASPAHTTSISSQSSQQHQNYGNSPGRSLNFASPPYHAPTTPNQSLPHPSPGSGLAASPLNPMYAPSPAGFMSFSSPSPCSTVQMSQGHSPGSSYMQTSLGRDDGSPFHSSSHSMTSPVISRPSPVRSGQSPGLHMPPSLQQSPQHHPVSSRVLPQRSWAGAIPTLLTYETLKLLCSRSKHPSALPGPDMSPLERFLGCVYMMRHLKRFVQSNQSLMIISNTEPGAIHFKLLENPLQFRVFLHSRNMQSLHLNMQPVAEQPLRPDDMQSVERFFDNRVVAPPYRPNTLLSFVSMLNMAPCVLKSFAQIMKLDMTPDSMLEQHMKWSVQWCLRVPPSAMPILDCGQSAIIQNKTKILFFLQITSRDWQWRELEEPPFFVLPLVYDMRLNLTQLVTQRDKPASLAMAAVSMQLKRFADLSVNLLQECSIFPAIRFLLIYLRLPPQQQQMSPNAAAGQQQVPNVGVQMMPGGQGAPRQRPYRGLQMPHMNLKGGQQ